MHPATILRREKSRGYDNSEGVALVGSRMHFEPSPLAVCVVAPVRGRERGGKRGGERKPRGISSCA